MRRIELRILGFAACGALLAVRPAVSEVVLDTEPAGAFVRLQGPLSVAGRTPITLATWLDGNYRLEVQGPGLATARCRLETSNGTQFRIRSSSNPQALLLPPGTEHFRTGETWRGFTFLGAGAVSGVAVWLEESDRRDAEDALDLARSAYESAQSEAEIEAARIAVLAADERAQDESKMRNLWTAYLGAVWGGAAVESWLLTPRVRLGTAATGRYVMEIPRAGAWQAVWRSALVPGSGQRYLGRQQRANFVSVAVLGLAAGSLLAHEEFLDAQRDQDNLQRLYDAAQTEPGLTTLRRELLDAADHASDRDTLRWTMVGFTCGAYLWNLLDALLVGHDLSAPSADAGDAPERHASLRWSVTPSAQGVQARMVWGLP